MTPSPEIPPDHPSLRYIGRWDVTPDRAVTVNSGSRLVFRTDGGPITAHFDVAGITAPAHLYISVDGNTSVMHRIERPEIALDIPAGEHNFELVVKDVSEHANRWVPPFEAALIFRGLTGAKLLPPPAPAARLIHFYGDSITQGVRALGLIDGPDGTDGTRSYAFLVAAAFGADAHQVGFGRQGVIRDGNGKVPPAPNAFAWNFAGSPADTGRQPDLVVVNQGSNDGGFPGAEFQTAYVSYLETIRVAFPDTTILALRPFGGFHAAELQQAAKDHVTYVDTTGWLSESDYCDGIHPTVDGHRRAADHLIDAISAITHWEKTT